jgi:hypothetical protein
MRSSRAQPRAYTRKKEKRKDGAWGHPFKICSIVVMPERDRLQWVGHRETACGFCSPEAANVHITGGFQQVIKIDLTIP